MTTLMRVAVAPLVLAALFAIHVQAAIGPTSDLHIVNKNIAPDGFTRS